MQICSTRPNYTSVKHRRNRMFRFFASQLVYKFRLKLSLTPFLPEFQLVRRFDRNPYWMRPLALRTLQKSGSHFPIASGTSLDLPVEDSEEHPVLNECSDLTPSAWFGTILSTGSEHLSEDIAACRYLRSGNSTSRRLVDQPWLTVHFRLQRHTLGTVSIRC